MYQEIFMRITLCKPLVCSMVADKVHDYLVHRDSLLAIQTFIQGLIEQADIEGVEIKFSNENVNI